MKLLIIASISAMTLMAACDTTNSTATKQQNGAVIGAVAGAALGNQFGNGNKRVAATAIGGITGLLVGSSIGQALDDIDRMKMSQASQSALEYGKSNSSTGWNNPDSGNSGSITPVRTYQQRGQYCREYQEKIVVGGRSQSAYGTACRQPDGQWKVVR